MLISITDSTVSCYALWSICLALLCFPLTLLSFNSCHLQNTSVFGFQPCFMSGAVIPLLPAWHPGRLLCSLHACPAPWSPYFFFVNNTITPKCQVISRLKPIGRSACFHWERQVYSRLLNTMGLLQSKVNRTFFQNLYLLGNSYGTWAFSVHQSCVLSHWLVDSPTRWMKLLLCRVRVQSSLVWSPLTHTSSQRSFPNPITWNPLNWKCQALKFGPSTYLPCALPLSLLSWMIIPILAPIPGGKKLRFQSVLLQSNPLLCSKAQWMLWNENLPFRDVPP